MKKSVFIFALVLGNLSVSAQAVWNKKLPIFSNVISFSMDHSRLTESSFLFTTSGEFMELNREGDITGYSGSTLPNYLLSNYLQKRSHPISGKPYFLMGWRKYPNPAYNLAYFKPDASGWQPLLTFGAAELGNIATPGPAVLELNDTSLIVVTQYYARKISSPRDTLWIEWAKPITLAPLSHPSAAVGQGGNTIFVTSKGEVSALNNDGFQLWVKSYNVYTFRGITLASDGLMVCGADTSGKAALVKLSFSGDLIWEKTYPEDVAFNALTPTMDGNIAITGKSADGNILLLKVSTNGDVIWRKTYQKGLGVTILAAPDAGYFLTGGSSAFYAIKTNAEGETSALDNHGLFRDRNLNNGGLSLTQVPSSTLFFNGPESALHLPASSELAPVFAHSPWLAGNDAGGNLHLSASAFGEIVYGGSDYRNGIVASPEEDFNRLWSVSRDEIARIRRDYGEDGDLDAPPPFDLLTWPAKGNPHFKQNLDFTCVTTNPDSLPAPFIDANGDGVYNVFDGDYPRIKGDRMLWWAITDQTDHQETNGQALGVDILMSVYAYDCPQDEGISQSLFVEYQAINRSGESYSDAYFGFHTDFDLGCPEDDYFGAIPDANGFFAYNSDAIDGEPGTNCPAGTATYGEHVPVETVALLSHPLDHSMYYHRGGSGGPDGSGNPTTPQEYLRSLQSIWHDGTPLTLGGNGYNPSDPSAIPTNYAFSDNPSDPQGWSMCTENLGIADRRMVNSHGPFIFAAGDTFSMQLAFTFHTDIPHPCPDVTGLVKPTILQIQQWHDDGTLDAHLDLGSVLTLASGQALVLNATQSNPSTTYSWSTGQNTPSITVNQTGEYTVTVTPISGCAYSETVLVKSSSGTSSPALPTWQLQPNPANDVLKITFAGDEMPATTFLRNAQGQTVATQNSTGNVVEISVANLPAGLYWAELWRERQFWGSRKLVIAR